MKILEGRGSKAPGRLGAMSLFATSAKSCAGTRNRK
jgi:hypothetical protein